MKSMMLVDPGARVEGSYFGYPFSGHVKSYRYHTLRSDAIVIWVQLDEEMDIFDYVRNSILVTVKADGTSIDDKSTYVRYQSLKTDAANLDILAAMAAAERGY